MSALDVTFANGTIADQTVMAGLSVAFPDGLPVSQAPNAASQLTVTFPNAGYQAQLPAPALSAAFTTSPQSIVLNVTGVQGPPGSGGGGGVSDGDKGDITVSGSGTVWAIDAEAVTLAKMANIATDSFIGRDTAGTGAPEVLSASVARTILNVADGATANAADAALRDRATHTGTQLAATVSDFSEAVDDRVASLLVAGSNITLNYNDAANTLTIAATGGGGFTPTFETVSKNLDATDAALNYTGSNLTSVVYASGVTKTLNYTGSDLTSVVLSGSTPGGIDLTKTLSYTGSDLTSISYS